MNESHDVIVIGLGPGGAMAAVELAKAGAKVLVLDFKPKKTKPCGGCVSRRWEWLLRTLDLPNDLWRHPVDRLWLTAPDRPPALWRTGEPGAYFVDRAELDLALSQAVRNAGVQVLEARALEMAYSTIGVTIKSTAGQHRAPWLVGADGAGGLMGRKLGLGRSKLAYRAVVEERPLPTHLAERLNHAALIELGGVPGGYAWAFARGQTVNLGMGYWCVKKKAGWAALPTSEVVKAFAGFLHRLGLGEPGPWRGWVIPCPGGGPPLVARGRACVVGDAAAAGDPFLGEGIGQAMFSGRLAAQAVLDGDLERYNRELKGLWREHRHGRLLARLIYGWPGFFQGLACRHPGAIELGFAVLRGELAQAGLWSAVAAKLLGREPTLDPAARGYYSKHLN